MVHSGGNCGDSRPIDDDSDLEILDANWVKVGGEKKASQVEITDITTHPCPTASLHVDHKRKRKLKDILKVPSMKRRQPNKEVPSCSGSKRDNILVEIASTIRSVNEVAALFKTAGICSTEYEVLIPSKVQRANSPPDKYMTVYKKQIKAGLTFPMHHLVVEVCNAMKVSPGQLSPNAHSMIIGFILCAQFYKIPLTTDYFFSLFKVRRSPIKGVYFCPSKGLQFLTGIPSIKSKWKEEFFFVRPRSNSWNCRTVWNEACLKPVSNASLAGSAVNLGITRHHFALNRLLKKKILVHGGIKSGVPSSKLFRSLMVKIKQLPKGRAKSPSRVSRPPTFSSTVNVADPSHSVSIETPATVPNMQNTLPVNYQHSLSSASPIDVRENQISNPSVPVADDHAQPQALPPHLRAVSQVLESMCVEKEHHQKLELKMQELTSQLSLSRSHVQNLEQELKLSESKRVQSENKATSERETIKRLEEKLRKFRSDSELHRNRIRRETIDAYKSSQEFLDGIEKVQKEAIDKFKSSQDFLCSLAKTRRDAIKSSQELLDSTEQVQKEAIDKFKSSQEFLGCLEQIREDAIEKFKLSDEFLERNDVIRKLAIRSFKNSNEFSNILGQTRKDAVKSFKSSNEFLNILDETKKDAVKLFKSPYEFSNMLHQTRKDAVKLFKSSDEFSNMLDQTRKDAVKLFKSSSEFFDFRDDTRKEAIEVFRKSGEFLAAVREEAGKYYANGPWRNSQGQVNGGTAAAVNMYIKPEPMR